MSAARLLWLTEHYWPGRGGMAVSCDRIVHALRRRGVHIALVHFRARHEAPPAVREHGSDRVVAVRPDAQHALARLWNEIEREGRYSHVVAFGGALPFVAGPVYAAWLGVPLVTLLRGNDFDTGIFWPERRPALEDAIRRAARVGCVAQGMRERVQRLFPHAPAVWTPNGIDLETWRALPSDRSRAREIRRPLAGRKVLGLFGELKAKKGVATLLEGIALAGMSRSVHLICAGAPPEDFVLPDGLTASVLPSMPRTDLIAWMLACDAVALPSDYDGFPNVLLEAAALGVPLVASTSGGASVVEEGVHGVLFRPGDAQDCAAALRRLSLLALDHEGILGLARRFSADAECERYLDLLEPREKSLRRLGAAT